MFKFLFSTLFLLFPLQAISQIQVSDAEILLQSRHIWRGEKLGNSPAIEPSVTLLAGRFSFNFWAAATLNNSYSEIDLIPSWEFDSFQLTLLDYYNPVQGECNRYLNFQEGKSRHSLELTIDNYSVEKQRLKWMIGTFLLGDQNEVTGNPFYSSYIEIKYPFKVLGIEAAPFAGLTPFCGYYADQFAFVNTGILFSKEFAISASLSVPVKVSIISNPDQNKYFVGITSGIMFPSLK